MGVENLTNRWAILIGPAVFILGMYLAAGPIAGTVTLVLLFQAIFLILWMLPDKDERE